MIIEIQTGDGPKKVRVCDYCKTTCIPSGRFCSSRCSWRHAEQLIEAQKAEKIRQLNALREWEAKSDGKKSQS